MTMYEASFSRNSERLRHKDLASLLRKGFAVSSALGKLRLFRAVREDKAVSLLHIAILAAAGAEAQLCTTSHRAS